MIEINDKSCGWINNLPQRIKVNKILKDENCDWLIIGAGYTGLSAARKLGNLHPNSKIILVDAQLAGEGASGRNSGYLVDTTLNDGFVSNNNLINYKKKTDLYKAGIEAVKNYIKKHQVNCDWNECGKYFASSQTKDEKILKQFSENLKKINFNHQILFEKDLKKKLGTNFYKVALYTKGGILLNPGKLVRSMIDVLPKNVQLLENSKLLNWEKNNGLIECNFKKFKIFSKRIIFCVNGFLRSLNIKKNYNFPLTLTASMTRPLSNSEFKSIGEPNEWGVLPVRPMGATIRTTKDRRILIRNTAEINNSFFMKHTTLNRRKIIHIKGLQKRFPSLPLDIIESSWSGIVCRSRNSSQLFGKIEDNIFVAGCYNGSGIGIAVLFGEQIAIKANNEQTKEINLIEERLNPILLPPQPFLNIGISLRMLYERFRANTEI